MLDHATIKLCAENNADWYQAIFAAHGLWDERTDDFWASDETGPPYYGQLVTLSASGASAQLQRIESLQRTFPEGFGLKDSFNRLALAGGPFRILFETSWLLRPSQPACALQAGWRRVTTPEELAQWEKSWQANGSPAKSRVFPTAVLDNPDLGFYGLFAKNGVVAGCAVNRSKQCLGLSNIFYGNGLENVMAGVVACAVHGADGLPVVGYEQGEKRTAALGAGFQDVASLRVWLFAG